MDDGFQYLIDRESAFRIIKSHDTFSSLTNARYDRAEINIFPFEKTEKFIIKHRCKEKYIDLVKEYTSFLYRRFKENPYTILDSRILKCKDMKRLFDKEQYDEIKAFLDELNDKYIKLLNGIKRGTKIDDLSLRYAISLIGRDDSLAEKTYFYLLNNFNNSNLVREFIAKYTAYLSSKELDVSYDFIYLNRYNFIHGEYMDCNGTYLPKSDVIFINSDKNNELLKLIQCVGHEMKHRKQMQSKARGKMDEMSLYLTMNSLFDYYDNDNDNLNYFNSETELDANDYGWDLAARLLSSYTNDKSLVKEALWNKNECLYDKAINIKYGNNQYDIVDGVTYNVSKLDEIIKNQPDLSLSDEILLFAYYYSTGNRIDFAQMVKTEHELKDKCGDKYKDLGKAFRCFYQYDLDRKVNINFSELKEIERKQLVNKLLELAIEEIKDINNILSLVKVTKRSFNINANAKVKQKISRIHYILNTLDRNNRYIHNLGTRSINLKLEKLLVSIDSLNIKLNAGLIERLFYAKNTYDIKRSGYKLQKVIR